MDSQKEKALELIDILIDDDVNVLQLGKSLKGNTKYNYETIRTIFRRSFGSVQNALIAYGLFEKNGTPNELEMERCCYISSNYDVVVNDYEKEFVMDLYNLSEIEFHRLIKPIKEKLLEEVLDKMIHDLFYRKVVLPREDGDSQLSDFIKLKFGNIFNLLRSYRAERLSDSLLWVCSGCMDTMSVSNFVESRGKRYGIESKCRSCYYEAKDKHHMAGNRQKRRAKEKFLPYDYIVDKILYSECMLTGDINPSIEHALPISIGHGGTTFGNCYPLRLDLNISKNDNHLFEWFEANKQRFELPQEKFVRLIDYLAVVNGLTSEEYREFYDWCFTNPRNIDEIKRDQRHSIEIWREASGKQFPLPAYTQTYYSNESAESEAVS